MNKVLFSKKSDNWATPKEIYNYFINKNGFIDPCPLYCEVDNLDRTFDNDLFINPPYSKINLWVDFAIKHHKLGNSVFMLLPVRTDTKWFKKLCNYGCSIYFFTGRLKFSNSGSAPFPSMLVWVGGIRGLRFFNTIHIDFFKGKLCI